MDWKLESEKVRIRFLFCKRSKVIKRGEISLEFSKELSFKKIRLRRLMEWKCIKSLHQPLYWRCKQFHACIFDCPRACPCMQKFNLLLKNHGIREKIEFVRKLFTCEPVIAINTAATVDMKYCICFNFHIQESIGRSYFHSADICWCCFARAHFISSLWYG